MKITFEGAKAYWARPWQRKLLRASWVLALVLVVAAVMGAVWFAADLMIPAAFVIIVAATLVVDAGRRGTIPMLATAEPLAAAREGLYDGDRLLASRDRARGALATLQGDSPVLALLTRSGPVLVKVDSLETARRLQVALQLDHEHHRVEVRYPKPMGLAIAGIVVLSMLAFVIVASWIPESSVLATLAIIPILLVPFWHTTVTIGDDGVSLRTLGRERFIPYSAIESVDAVEPTDAERLFMPRLVLASGRAVKLDRAPELQRRSGVQMDEPVFGRARDAHDRYRTRAARAHVLPLSLSAKSTGSPADRVRALFAKEHGGDAYRQRATDEDALRRAVDEPTLPPRLRAEAALMLGAAGNADDLERIRRAAERSACRPLRQLFEAVADGASEAKLARALGRVG